MDTSRSNSATKSLVSSIGVSSWKQLIPSYSSKLYNKVSCTIGKLTQVNGYQKNRLCFKQLDSPMVLPDNSVKREIIILIYRDTSRNQNISWGYTQSFKKKLNVSSSPRFCTTLRVTGANKSSVQIKIRFFSGKQYFECTKAIPTDRTVHLSTSLAKWKYRKKVTKIQILAQPVKGASWKSGAKFELNCPGTEPLILFHAVKKIRYRKIRYLIFLL